MIPSQCSFYAGSVLSHHCKIAIASPSAINRFMVHTLLKLLRTILLVWTTFHQHDSDILPSQQLRWWLPILLPSTWRKNKLATIDNVKSLNPKHICIKKRSINTSVIEKLMVQRKFLPDFYVLTM